MGIFSILRWQERIPRTSFWKHWRTNNLVKLADYMCDHYEADLADLVAIYVLEQINQRDTAAKLKQEKGKALRPSPPPASSVQDYKMKYRAHVQKNYCWIKDMNSHIGRGSMADMISKCCPSDNPPLVEISRRPEKLLFVIDGFDELRFCLDQPQNDLCSHPWEMKPVEIILSSLFRKFLLPECSLLIKTRPAALQKLEQCLVCECSAEILGFSAADREEYFHMFFENKEEGKKAFQFVKGNKMVFTMCLVPIMCWIVCTVMKRQLESGEDLAQTAKTTTGIYLLYVSSLLKSLSSKSKQNLHVILKRLCCLAAGGIWKQSPLLGGGNQ